MSAPPTVTLPAALRERARDHFDLTEPADQERLMNRLPPELESASDADLGDAERLPADAVQAWIRDCKAV
jgi:hypothetical protein